MELYVSQLVLFLMLFLRTTSLIAMAPVVGHIAVPVQVKVGLGLFMAIRPVSRAGGADAASGSAACAAGDHGSPGGGDGVVDRLFHGSDFLRRTRGGRIDRVRSRVVHRECFDPETGPNNVIGGFLYLVAMLVFLLVNGHHVVLQALQLSYEAVPLNGLVFSVAGVDRLVRLTGMVFVVGVKCAAPVIVASFLREYRAGDSLARRTADERVCR